MNLAIRVLILLGGVIIALEFYWLNKLMTPPPPAAFNFFCMFFVITLITFVIPHWFGRKVVESLEVQVMYLSLVQRRLDPLKPSGRCIEWLERVGNVQRNEEYIKAGYDGCGLNYLKKFHFNYKADQMISMADDLISQGNTFLQPENHLHGTMNSYMKEVIGFIKAKSGNSGGLLGIWGLGGVGKSSLLKLVFDSRPQYDNGYLKVMFVCAGIASTVGQVQKAIAASMGLPIERNETSQGKIIHEHLHGTSFLLLIDDLWEYLDLEAVGIPSPLGMVISSSVHGCLQRQICRKVVLTTRARAKCDQMGCRNNTIQMKSFAEEDVLELYRTGGSSWPGVIDGVDDVDLPEQNSSSGSSSSSSSPGTQLTWPHLNTVRDVQPQDPQDLLPGVTRYYKQVRCFTEAEGAQSLLLGFWGMRGVGKTTLLRLVRDSYTGNACFDHIMFVGAGTRSGVTNVQDAIAINLGFDLDMMSSEEFVRAEYIFDYLEHKSFLLILDDIREPLNWWAIGLPTLSHKQQKIILATRTRAACALMGCHAVNTIEVKCLGKDDAWNLFRDKVGLVIIDNHPQVHHLAKKMVSQCGGLPLALCALGRAMSNKKDPREWRSAYSRLRAMHLEPFEIDDQVVTSILNPL